MKTIIPKLAFILLLTGAAGAKSESVVKDYTFALENKARHEKRIESFWDNDWSKHIQDGPQTGGETSYSIAAQKYDKTWGPLRMVRIQFLGVESEIEFSYKRGMNPTAEEHLAVTVEGKEIAKFSQYYPTDRLFKLKFSGFRQRKKEPSFDNISEISITDPEVLKLFQAAPSDTVAGNHTVALKLVSTLKTDFEVTTRLPKKKYLEAEAEYSGTLRVTYFYGAEQHPNSNVNESSQ